MNEDLAELLRSGDPIASIVVDVSTDALRTPSQADGQRRDVADTLRAAGADEDAIAGLAGVVQQVPGAEGTVGVAALAAGGTVVQQAAPGSAPTQPEVEVSPAPDLSALLRARERAIPVLVVEARAAGGTIVLHPAPGVAPADPEEVTGDDTSAHQAHAGGIAQSAHAHSAEDALSRNARLLADRAAALARRHGVGAVLLTGDPRSAELVARELPQLEGVTAALGKDTDAAGADPDDVTTAVGRLVDAVVAAAQAKLVDDLAAGSYRLGALGTDDVAEALRAGAVETLLLAPGELPGELLALDDAPWVARSSEDALGAGVIGSVPARAALIRAAVLTGASVRFPAAGALPDGATVAAHRYRPADD